jgi:hypothetical protein
MVGEIFNDLDAATQEYAFLGHEGRSFGGDELEVRRFDMYTDLWA